MTLKLLTHPLTNFWFCSSLNWIRYDTRLCEAIYLFLLFAFKDYGQLDVARASLCCQMPNVQKNKRTHTFYAYLIKDSETHKDGDKEVHMPYGYKCVCTQKLLGEKDQNVNLFSHCFYEALKPYRCCCWYLPFFLSLNDIFI